MKRKLRIVFFVENAAFEENISQEVGEVLKKLGEKISNKESLRFCREYHTNLSDDIYDRNGNVIGAFYTEGFDQ